MLWYYDISRRKFLQVMGLSMAGAALHGCRLATGTGNRKQATDESRKAIPASGSIALAIHDAGADIVACVPSTGTAKIFDAYNELTARGLPYSYNEEVAYTIAHSAGLNGRRSAVVLKSLGLAKASNSLIDSLTAGTTAGFVAIVTYDKSGRHSDNIFEYLDFVKGSGIPFKVPKDEADYYRSIMDCFLWSERLQLPVGVLVDSDMLDKKVETETLGPDAVPVSGRLDPLRHVLCPPMAGYQYGILQAKLSGNDWRKVPRPSLLHIPDDLPQKYRQAVRYYLPVFEVFGKLRNKMDFVSGDTGVSTLFAFPPFNCIDACTYYGGSLPLAIGAHLAGKHNAWAVTGDYSFIAAGHMGLVEAISRNIPLKVLVLYNGCALSTGGQPLPENVFNHVVSGYQSHVRYIGSPMDTDTIESVLKPAIESNRLEIVIADYVKGK